SSSNWGVAVLTDHHGGAPEVTYTAPFGQPLTEVFTNTNGSNSVPALDDAGDGALVSRNAVTTLYVDTYSFQPGTSPCLLPALGAASLSQDPLIDNEGRITVTAQYSPTFQTYLERYDPATGWQTLPTPSGENVVQSQPAYAVDARGDISFMTYSHTT